MHRLTLIAIAAVLLLSGLAAAPAIATYPGPNGRIFFSTLGCGIGSVSVGGTGFNCVSLGGTDPAISPDRRRIVATIGDMHKELLAMNVNGSSSRQVTRTPSDSPSNYAGSFSPDSRQILWAKFGGGAGVDGLYLMNADGSGQHQLTGDQGQDPVFSPNGAQIAYAINGIRIANADGSGSHVVLPDQITNTTNPLGRYVEVNREVSWSPDGRRLAFSRQTATTTFNCNPFPNCSGSQTVVARDVWVMNSDGSDVRQLTSTPLVDEVDPSFSPNGAQIAYFRLPVRQQLSDGQIWVMNADGSRKRAVARGTSPEWSSVPGGPGRPRLLVRFQKLNRHSRCLGKFDGIVATVKTNASRKTLFDMFFYLDRKLYDHTFSTTSLGAGLGSADSVRRGRHRIRVLVTDPGFGDRLSRTLTFRTC
jgi:TolB protein